MHNANKAPTKQHTFAFTK